MAAIAQPNAKNHGVWSLDPTHIQVSFAVWRMMIATVEGHFAGVSGTVSVRDGDLATANVDVTVDVTTVDTREAKRDEHLRSADFFDAARYPTMTFKSRRVDALPEGHYRVIGDLTIRGVMREVGFDIESDRTGDPWGQEHARFKARGVISRRDFGLTWNQFLEAGGVLVGDEVKIVIDAGLVRQADHSVR